MLKACLDTNVWISGLLYSGASKEIVDLAFNKKFQVITSTFILNELERNLIYKFEVKPKAAGQLCEQIALFSDIYEPKGSLSLVKEKHADNLILETAWLGEAEFLITGDKKHLFPLNGRFHKIHIITPATFLPILKKDIVIF